MTKYKRLTTIKWSFLSIDYSFDQSKQNINDDNNDFLQRDQGPVYHDWKMCKKLKKKP